MQGPKVFETVWEQSRRPGSPLMRRHAVLEHAVRLGRIERNPAKGVRRLASTARKRHLSRVEIGQLGEALCKARSPGQAEGLCPVVASNAN